jgi:calcineurin-like phosphoesterase family protein
MTSRNIFFTSDQHYWHDNIIKYCNRPFKSSEEMNEAMLENHNKIVKPTDVVYHVGDVAFNRNVDEIVKLVKKLNGYNILISGNHDYHFDKNPRLWPGEYCRRILELKGKFFHHYNPTLCHYPMISWDASFHGSFQLHGHTHGTVPFNPKIRRMDVGVDSNNFTPVAWEDIVSKLGKIPTPKEQLSSSENSTDSYKNRIT